MKIDRRTLRWLIIAAIDGHAVLPHYGHSYAMSEVRTELEEKNSKLDDFLEEHEGALEFELLPVPLPVADGVADEPTEGLVGSGLHPVLEEEGGASPGHPTSEAN